MIRLITNNLEKIEGLIKDKIIYGDAIGLIQKRSILQS